MKKLYTFFTSLIFFSASYSQQLGGGLYHSISTITNCSLDSTKTRGYNVYGQLGNGNNTSQTNPVQVSGLTGVASVGGGYYHSLFVKSNGTVWTTGYNVYGQLGDGTTVNKNAPVQVTTLSGVVKAVGGIYHSLFLKNDGTVWSCGYNVYGQLGNGNNINQSVPVLVTTLSGIVDIAAWGYHSLFLKNDGTVWSCGYNVYGQLGDGTTTNRNVPVQVSGQSGIVSIGAGFYHSMFVKNTGTVSACGYNIYGQLGNGNNTNQSLAVPMVGLINATKVAGGLYHSLILRSDSTVWSTGYNAYGQLGDGTFTNKNIPAQISSLSGITAIGTGGYHSLFAKQNKTEWACGYNVYGQLGDGTTTTQTIPVAVAVMNKIPTMTATGGIACPNGSISLSASGATAYLWAPSTGLSCTTCSNPTATPSATTTYTVTGTTSGCSNTKAVTATIDNPVVTVSASPATICLGSSSQLNNNKNTDAIIGTGTLQNATTTYPASYGQWYTGSRHQLLVLSSELTAAGLTAGNIAGLRFDVASPNGTYTNFNISMGTTALNSLTTTFQGGLTTVYQIASFTPVAGLNTHMFQTPFYWDGVSNVIIETCFLNCTTCPNTACTSYTYNAVHNQTSTSFNSSLYYYADGNCGVCSQPTGTTALMRPNFRLVPQGGTYSWAPSASLSSATLANPVATPTTTTTYTLSFTNVNGCTASNTVMVTVNPIPTVTATAANSAICFGGSTTLNGNGATSYAWAPAASLNNASLQNPTATPTATTTYSLTGTDGNGCSNTMTVMVTVNPLPSVTVSSNGSAICYGDQVSLNALGANTYSWMPSSSLSNATIANPDASPTTTTTYTVTGTDGNGCSNTATITITVNPLPVMTAAANNPSICMGNNTGLSATGASTYSWTPSGSLNNPNVPNPIASPTITTTYTVTGFDANLCSNTATVMVTVNPLPVVTASASSSTICMNDSTALTATGATTYLWTPASGLSNANISNPNASPSTTTTYTVTGTDGNGCSNNATVMITVNPLPVVTASANTSAICMNDSTALTATGATAYMWTPASGLSNANISNPNASPTVTTTYTVIGTDGNSCSNTATVMITVNPLPNITASGTATICSGGTTPLNATGATSYSWMPAASVNNPNIANPTASPTVTTTYTVTGTDGNGCSNTATVMITVNPLPVVTASSNMPAICLNDSASFTATGATTYLWMPASGLSNANIANPNASPTVTTTYTVTGTDGNGCSNTATVMLTVNPLPVVNLGNDIAFCGSNITLNAGSGFSSYLWSTGATTQTIVVNTSGNYTVTVTNSFGCTNSDDINVNVNAATPVVLGNDTSICQNTSLTLNAGAGYASYLWNTGATTQMITVSTAGLYSVTVTDNNGCTASDKINVTVITCAGIAEAGIPIPGMSCYPNPSQGRFTIGFSEKVAGRVVIEIADIRGRKVFAETRENIPQGSAVQVDMTAEASGVYMLHVYADSATSVIRLVMQK